MRKLLLIAICLITVNAYADYDLEWYQNRQHQRQVEENQKDMLNEMRIERQMEWAHNLEQDQQSW